MVEKWVDRAFRSDITDSYPIGFPNHLREDVKEENIYYDYTNTLGADVRSMVPIINLHGKDLVGLELGVLRGDSYLTMLFNCPNIKTLYGVDAYKPFNDYINESGVESKEPTMTFDQKDIEFVKIYCYHRLSNIRPELKDKIRFLEMDSNEVLKHVKDDELDFIFLDAYLSKQQAVQDLEAWYPKVKKGGLFSGHDYFSPMVYEAVSEFRTKNNIDNLMSTYDNTFVWVK